MTAYTAFNPTPLFADGDDFDTRKVTILTSQNVSGTPMPRGTLLGKVTSGGKYKISLAGASDGSQLPRAITADDVDTSGGDVVCRVYESGTFAFEMCTVDGSWTIDTLNASMSDQSRDIYFRSVGIVA